jgi:hypothetical protein
MSRKRRSRDSTATFCRSYLVTLGLAFIALSIFIWHRDGGGVATWPWWGFALLAVFFFGGFSLISFGLLGPSSKMESWAEISSRHEASLIIIVLAYPVYLLLVRSMTGANLLGLAPNNSFKPNPLRGSA